MLSPKILIELSSSAVGEDLRYAKGKTVFFEKNTLNKLSIIPITSPM